MGLGGPAWETPTRGVLARPPRRILGAPEISGGDDK